MFRFIIYALIFSVFSFDWLWGYLAFLPRQMTWLTDILCLILLFRVVIDLITGKIRIRNNFITYFVYLWLFLSIPGAVLNDVRMPVFLAGLRNYFKFIPLFLFLSWYPLPDEFIKKAFRLVIFVGVIQVFFVIPEKIIYSGQSGDYVVGSLGKSASGTLAIFQLLALSLIMALYKKNHYSLKRFLTLGGLVLLPAFITEAKVVFFLLPVLFAIYFWDHLRKQLARGIFLAILGIFFFKAGVYIYENIYGDIQAFFDEAKVKEYLGVDEISYDKSGGLKRVSKVRFMLENIEKDAFVRIFGVGAGNASNSFFPGSMGEYYKKHIGLNIDGVFLAKLGWEFGYSGMALFAVFFLLLYKMKPPQGCDAFYEGIFHGTKGLAFITAASFIYDPFLIVDPLSFTFWLYLGTLNNKLLTAGKEFSNSETSLAAPQFSRQYGRQ